MWQLYGLQGKGVAIQTTVGNLIASMANATQEIFIGTVRYVDYRTATFPEGNIFWPLIHKRLSFAHEMEVRAVHVRWPESSTPGPEHPIGVGVDIDFDVLAPKVFANPSSQQWERDAMNAVMAKFGAGGVTETSHLAEDPLY